MCSNSARMSERKGDFMSIKYSECAIGVRIVARGMADGKYDLAFSKDPSAKTLAEAEYDLLMKDYIQHGEDSELAKRSKKLNIEL